MGTGSAIKARKFLSTIRKYPTEMSMATGKDKGGAREGTVSTTAALTTSTG